MLVYCLRCISADGGDEVHIFSDEGKRQAYSDTRPEDVTHVFYDYLIDHPERMTERNWGNQ